MTDDSIDPRDSETPRPADASPSRPSDPHADKYNDPRAKITRRGILMGLAVFVLGIFGAAASIYFRRTRLGETTRFWGQETITALQLAERMQLLPRGGSDFAPVELTATPGLGHLRRALLDERNFDWQTEDTASVAAKCSKKSSDIPQCVQIRLSDPTAHRFGTIEIDIDLSWGMGWPQRWVSARSSDDMGPAQASQLFDNDYDRTAKAVRLAGITGPCSARVSSTNVLQWRYYLMEGRGLAVRELAPNKRGPFSSKRAYN